MHFCDLRDIHATVTSFPLGQFRAFCVQFLCMFFMDETSGCTGVKQDSNLSDFRSFSHLQHPESNGLNVHVLAPFSWIFVIFVASELTDWSVKIGILV